MASRETNAEALALQALVWTLGDSARAARLLDLTGLDPAGLRDRASEPQLLAATLGFLESYEPDLLACADALDVKPAALVAARIALEQA
ncbi:DUF3572 family protein [Sphingomonas sp. M1-B02]|uniref:DUF3572 family protein n=1 Tax=Sphingomonas sp. M1-B02 TaxID=3114300 RepID=UPI00223EC126|nr:DUF3572 family protein [Sphingomonas sp. S6-11]UZK65586.1 DUF3572 domain-containing protein [Sphingomonas sp. S6-11]